MDEKLALSAFGALSQSTRLSAFRLLIRAGREGMSAGDIASALGAKPNTTSQNLAVLVQSGLARNRRDGRRIIYYADTHGVTDLLRFLLEDCCGGRADECGPLIASLSPCCEGPDR